jgi:hypothetical protein
MVDVQYALDVEHDCVYEFTPVPGADDRYKRQPVLGAGFQRFHTEDEIADLVADDDMYPLSEQHVEQLEEAHENRIQRAEELLEEPLIDLYEDIS